MLWRRRRSVRRWAAAAKIPTDRWPSFNVSCFTKKNRIISWAALESFVKADRHSTGQNLNRERGLPRRRPVSHGGTQRPSGDDVRLPVRPAFQSGDGVIGGE